jgi:ankyrin repeat protein
MSSRNDTLANILNSINTFERIVLTDISNDNEAERIKITQVLSKLLSEQLQAFETQMDGFFNHYQYDDYLNRKNDSESELEDCYSDPIQFIPRCPLTKPQIENRLLFLQQENLSALQKSPHFKKLTTRLLNSIFRKTLLANHLNFDFCVELIVNGSKKLEWFEICLDIFFEDVQQYTPSTIMSLFNLIFRNLDDPLDWMEPLIRTWGGLEFDIEEKRNVIQFDYLFGKPNTLNVIKFLFQERICINIDKNGESGRNLLHCACININSTPIDVFRYLIEEKGASVMSITNDRLRSTPIQFAISNWKHNTDIEILKYLLNQPHVDVNHRDGENRNLIHYLCININNVSLELVHYLIQHKKVIDLHCKDKYQNTPLHFAFSHLRKGPYFDITVQIVEDLLGDNTINVEDKNRQNRSLLHCACDNIDNIPITLLKRLISLQFDINDPDIKNNTPIHLAFRSLNFNASIDIFQYILSQPNILGDSPKLNSRDESILHMACKNVQYIPLSIFQLLIDKLSFDLLAKNVMNLTPLNLVLANFKKGCDIDIVRYLFNRPNLNINQTKWTTIFSKVVRLITTTPIEIFQFLIEEKRIGTNIINSYLYTAFSHISCGLNVDILNYLLKVSTCDVNHINTTEGDTILHQACKHANLLPLEIFRYLIEIKGADLTIQNDTMRTPLEVLFFQFKGHFIEIFKYLFNSQSEFHIHQIVSYGSTWLHYVCQEGYGIHSLDVIKYLIEEMNFDPNSKDEWGNTPLHHAFYYFDDDYDINIINYLITQSKIRYNLTNLGETNNEGNSCIDLAFRSELEEGIEPSEQLILFILQSDLLKYGTETIERYLVSLCSAPYLSIKVIKTLCNGMYDIDYSCRSENGQSLLHLLLLLSEPRLNKENRLAELLEYLLLRIVDA